MSTRIDAFAEKSEAPAADSSKSAAHLAQYAIPSAEGNRILRQASNEAAAVGGHVPPPLKLTESGKSLADAGNLLRTEAVLGGLGAVAGAGSYGVVGKVFGQFAEQVIRQPASASAFDFSTQLGLDMAKAGALRGGVTGLVIGAALYGGYELVKHYEDKANHANNAKSVPNHK